MSSQRPFFLSTVFAAFRQQSAATSRATTSSQQPNKQGTSASSYSTPSTTAAAAAAAARSMAAASSTSASSPSPAAGTTSPSQAASSSSTPGTTTNNNPLQSPRTSGPIPVPCHGRRRGSDSSTEGFRDVRGADKWYVGGRTATGEERFFRLGVVRRVRSGDRLSLDKLSL